VQAIGLSTSGSLGARLVTRLGIVTSWMTILRRILALPTPTAGAVTALGIDDFSFKRGRRFGTILVDLDLHQVIDILEERSSQTSADWMRAHPEITYVSRDRGKDYAQGASEGAPQATQISDRFHLMKNFVESVEAEVSRCYRHLRQAQPPLPPSDLPAPDEWRQAPDADAEQKRLARLADKEKWYAQVKDLLARGFSAKEIAGQLDMPVRTVYRWQERERCPAHQSQRTKRPDRQERYEQMKELRLRGLSQKEIAQRFGIGVRTVQRWQGREPPRANAPRRKRRSIFDPYAAYVLSR
jgi:transposase